MQTLSTRTVIMTTLGEGGGEIDREESHGWDSDKGGGQVDVEESGGACGDKSMVVRIGVRKVVKVVVGENSEKGCAV